MGTSNANKSLGKLIDIYPAIDGWNLFLSTRGKKKEGEWLHTGYTSSRAKPCPCCHRLPVFERAVEDRSVPAKVFVAICPRCEMRAKGSGTLEKVLAAWNRGDFTRDTLIVHHRLKNIDEDAADMLSSRVVAGAVDEAVCLVALKNRIQAEINMTQNSFAREAKEVSLREVLGSLRKVQNFIDTNPLMLNHDPEAVLSLIRKRAYPDLSFEDRQKIPLRLVSM